MNSPPAAIPSSLPPPSPAEAQASPGRDRRLWWGFGLILLVGGAARLLAYAHARSLWLDEVLLARNILDRSFLDLLEPLEGKQVAPVGFLWLVKSATLALGDHEWGLRLMPLLAGLLALALFLPLVKQVTSWRGQLVALALFAASASLVWFSNELKQYGFDALSAVVLLLLGLRLLAGAGGAGRWLALAGVGVLCLFVSHASVFIAGGVAAVLTLNRAAQRQWAAAGAATLIGLLWAGCFVLMYLLFYQTAAGDSFLVTYWSSKFMPLVPDSAQDLKWFFTSLHVLFEGAMGGREPILGSWFTGLWIVLALVGCYAVGSRRGWVLAMLLSPLPFALLASGLGKYPFEQRLLLFAAPPALALMGAGAGFLAEAAAGQARRGGVVVIAAVLVFPALHVVNRMARPYTWEEMRPLCARLLERLDEDKDAVLYVEKLSRPAFFFYWPRQGGGEVEVLPASYLASDPQLLERDLALMRSHGRVWVLMSHDTPMANGYSVRSLLHQELGQAGTLIEQIRIEGAEASLYDLNRSPDAPSPPEPENDDAPDR
ncbi:MAG: hypothetical protein GVY24_03430 [Planctomycetes bacterium]|jgi:hypothetical protein|nr:hypothetical protein [Planctomycetota bacterium]